MLHLCIFCQAMYAAVHDAALVAVNALVKFLGEDKGKQKSILLSYPVNRNCPLRSMKEEDSKVGQRILEGIKKVLACLSLLLTLEIDVTEHQ